MCIAIMSPQDVVIPYAHLKESFESNPDGAGFMYADNNQLTIEKGFMDFNSFYEAYAPHQEKACAIHFRIKTHGKVDPDNTHPFQVGTHLGVIHNGIINNVDCSDNPSMSDTYHFNAKVLQQIYRRDSRFAYKDHFKELIKSYIGYSKLVFLNNKGHFSIVNEKAGFWDEGAWYSNRSYLTYTPPVVAPKKAQIKPVTDNNPVFRVGSRVKINGDTPLYGTLMHFTGGLMAGILIDGTDTPTLIAMVKLDLMPALDGNPFKCDDWVVRKDDPDGPIGTVTGTSKNLVWVEWMDYKRASQGTPAVQHVINCEKLEMYHYSDY